VAVWCALVVLLLGQRAHTQPTFPMRGICSDNPGSVYTVAELERAVPRAARIQINRTLGGNFYNHPGIGTGICRVRSDTACFQLCNATPGCGFYASSMTQSCYACFLIRACNVSTIQSAGVLARYTTFQMPTASPTSAPTLHPCISGSTNQCDLSTTYCTDNVSGLPSVTGSDGLYACACNGLNPVRVTPTSCGSSTPTAAPVTAAPTGAPTLHPCAGGQHACIAPGTYCTDIIGANMTAIGMGSNAYACACNISGGFTLRQSSWSCGYPPILPSDDDLAVNYALSNTAAVEALNASVAQLQATVLAQNQTITRLVAMLRAAVSAGSSSPQAPVGSTPDITATTDGSLRIRGHTVRVESSSCTAADLCDATSFAASLKEQLQGL